jgi:hypothetical protein
MRCQCYSLFHVCKCGVGVCRENHVPNILSSYLIWGREGCHGRDRLVVGFTTASAISAYHWSCEFESSSWQGVLDTTVCDKVCPLLVAEPWCSLGTPVSSTNKTDSHNITGILLKVALTL